MTMNKSETEKFCLSWSQYVPSMLTTLRNLLECENSKDVTLVSEDGVQFKCHRFILNATSGFFNKLFSKGALHKDPIIYITNITSEDLKSILKFMYLGQVFLEQNHLNSFMFAANKLMVQGLTDFQNVAPEKTPKPEHIINYDYQRPKVSPPTVEQSTGEANDTDESVACNLIEQIQQKSKSVNDPIKEFVDGLPVKQENPSPNGACYSIPVVDLMIPQLGGEREPTSPQQTCSSSDSMSLQFLEWSTGEGGDKEFVVTSADSSIQSAEQRYFKCEKCDYKSTKLFNVKKHTAAIHDGVRYPCKFCDYKATESGHLRKHVRARHGNQTLN